MPDLVIREQEGWIEITSLIEENLPGSIIHDVWAFLSEEREGEAIELLNRELGEALEEILGPGRNLYGVKVLECPRDGIRAWARR